MPYNKLRAKRKQESKEEEDDSPNRKPSGLKRSRSTNEAELGDDDNSGKRSSELPAENVHQKAAVQTSRSAMKPPASSILPGIASSSKAHRGVAAATVRPSGSNTQGTPPATESSVSGGPSGRLQTQSSQQQVLDHSQHIPTQGGLSQDVPIALLASMLASQSSQRGRIPQTQNAAAAAATVGPSSQSTSTASDSTDPRQALESVAWQFPALQPGFHIPPQLAQLYGAAATQSFPYNPPQQQQVPQQNFSGDSSVLQVLGRLLTAQQQNHVQRPPQLDPTSASNSAMMQALLMSMSPQQQQQLLRQQQQPPTPNIPSLSQSAGSSLVPGLSQLLHPDLVELLRNSSSPAGVLSAPGPTTDAAGPAAPAGFHPETIGEAKTDGGGSSSPNSCDLASLELTGRPPVVMYIPTSDEQSLSEFQCLVRKQIELFEADEEIVESQAQGRNKPIFLGQVGIRCRHCTSLPQPHRARGAVFFPSKARGIYQAAQNMANTHLTDHCQHISSDLKEQIAKLQSRKSSAGGGKK